MFRTDQRGGSSLPQVLSLMLAAILMTVVSSAKAQEAHPVSDDAIWGTILETYILKQEMRDAVFRDENVRAEIRRVGFEVACPVIEESIDQVALTLQDEFRRVALLTVRSDLIPPSTQTTKYTLLGIIPSNGLLERILKMRYSAMFSEANSLGLAVARKRLESGSKASSDWRGRLTDWDFERVPHLAFLTGCLVEKSSKPDQAKRFFDGFYRTREEW